MLQAAEINRSFDLVSLVDRDTSLRKSGGRYFGPCPFCGGIDRFVLKSTHDGWRWYCRGYDNADLADCRVSLVEIEIEFVQKIGVIPRNIRGRYQSSKNPRTD